MTKHDLRMAGYALAVVVGLGLLIGYVVGVLTQPRVPDEVSVSAPVAFDEVPADGAAEGVPGYREIWVNDYADLLDPGAEARIRENLQDLRAATGIEMTVLTIERMADYGHDGAIEPFATRLFNTWGIGNATRNDGVLVLVSVGDRTMRIEIGAGYGPEWDGRMKRVIDTAFLPAFRSDDYQRGIERGVDETIRMVAGVYPDEFEQGTLERGFSRIWRMLEDFGAAALGALAVPLGAVAFFVRSWLRRRPRPCPQCSTLMARMGEEADDAHLDGGQRLEEYLHSVDYDVWRCPSCDHMSIHGYKNWFSSKSTCPRCGYRTMETDTTVLQSATTTSTGRKRVDYSCQQCGYENSEVRTIPKKTKSSSGGSSFGGGRSSGGGASGSW